MNLQIYRYSNNSELIYETDNIQSFQLQPDVQNILEIPTLGWYKVVQRIRNPIDSYVFVLQGVLASEINQLRYDLRLENYACYLTYPKIWFWLTTKKAWFIKITKIDNTNYKYLNITDTNQLVDVELSFSLFTIS